jgi:hypothetical protein
MTRRHTLGISHPRTKQTASLTSLLLLSYAHRPHKPNADLMSVVRNAGMQAGAMYNKFRDQGIFVGKDAWYVPLPALPSPPIRRTKPPLTASC